MRKIIALCSALMFSVALTACGQATDDTNDQLEKEQTQGEIDNSTADPADNSGQGTVKNKAEADEAEHQEDMKKMMASLDFKEVDIEVTYGKDKTFEIEIEHNGDGLIEAKVEDEVNGLDIEDDLQAFNHIFSDVKKLTIDRSMEKQDVIDQVLKGFDLSADYVKFKAEFKFDDGTKLSFEDNPA